MSAVDPISFGIVDMLSNFEFGKLMCKLFAMQEFIYQNTQKRITIMAWTKYPFLLPTDVLQNILHNFAIFNISISKKYD